MPTYDLACRDCGHRFELFLTRLLRDGDLVCPECGSRAIDRGVGGGILGSGTRVAGGNSNRRSASCDPGRFS